MKTALFPIVLFILIFPESVFAQYVKVSGNVVSNQTSDTIKFASVFESFSEIGTITNQHGFFALLLKPGKQRLKIKESGYKNFVQEFYLSNDTTINVTLIPNNAKEKPGVDELQASEDPNSVRNTRRRFLFF